MSEHRANLTWKRGEKGFAYKEYSRDHRWDFPSNGQFFNASAAPKYMGNEECVDPEEAYVVALSSCHMLTFLAVASVSGFVVDSYADEAVGKLAPNENKKMVITKITMNPVIQFSGDKIPNEVQIEQLHQKAHHECFLANSVNTEIVWH